MKIIEEGDPVSKLIHKTTCPNCGCIFEWMEGEKGTRYSHSPKNESAWVVTCPQKGCKNEIYI